MGEERRARTGETKEEPITRPWVEVASGAHEEAAMNGLIYLVGLVVVIMFILSFLGLR
jgi:hypothetical protein